MFTLTRFIERGGIICRTFVPTILNYNKMSAKDTLHIPVHIAENEIEKGTLQLISVLRPKWQHEYVTFKVYTDGITNKLIGCVYKKLFTPENVIIVRIYGNKTELIIDRKAELRNMRSLQSSGLSPKLIASFDNGLTMEFVPGVTLTTETVRDPKIFCLIAKALAQMHKTDIVDDPDVHKYPHLWQQIEKMLAVVPEKFSDSKKQERFAQEFGTLEQLKIEYEHLKRHLSKVDCPIVFAHNDLLLGNVIYNECEGKVTLIDYEYASYNYQPYDIANHFAEFVGVSNIDNSNYPSSEFRKRWLEVYLSEFEGEDFAQSRLETLHKQVDQFTIAANYMWGIWALLQAHLSHIDFDFLLFAKYKLGEYFRLKDGVYRELTSL